MITLCIVIFLFVLLAGVVSDYVERPR